MSLLFQNAPHAGKGQSRIRPSPRMMNHEWEQGWRGLMVSLSEEQGWGSPAPPGIWHIVLSRIRCGGEPLLTPALPWVPWPPRTLQLCQGFPGCQRGILQGLVQGLGSSSHEEGRSTVLCIPCGGVYFKMTKWFQLPKKMPRVCSGVDGVEKCLRPCFHETVLKNFVACRGSMRKTVALRPSFLEHTGLIRKLKLK